MFRRFAWLLVLAALVGQSLGLSAHAATGARSQDLAHALLHWADQPHHHHDQDDGGAPHHDDSHESRNHVTADGALGAPVLLPAPIAQGAIQAQPTPLRANEPVPPSPLLDGIRRPPRLSA